MASPRKMTPRQVGKTGALVKKGLGKVVARRIATGRKQAPPK